MLERQEKQRAEEFTKRDERTKMLMGKMANTMIKQQDERAVSEMRKIRKHEEDKNRKEDEAVRKKRLKMQHDIVSMRAVLETQIVQKAESQLIEKEIKERYIREQMQKDEQVGQEQLVKKNEAKNRELILQKFIQTQIDSKNDKKSNMTEQEVRLNR